MSAVTVGERAGSLVDVVERMARRSRERHEREAQAEAQAKQAEQVTPKAKAAKAEAGLVCRDVSDVSSPKLPTWGEDARGVSNALIRSALFSTAKLGSGTDRPYYRGAPIWALSGIEIIYTGEALDQGDLDVYMCVTHLVRRQPLGSRCRVRTADLLRALGLTDGGDNIYTLDERINRLIACSVQVRIATTGSRYTGSLFTSEMVDGSGWRVITLDPAIAALFGGHDYTAVHWPVRRRLRRHKTAQWIHAYYATHDQPMPLKVETLYHLCGSTDSTLNGFAKTLRKGLDAVQRACADEGQAFSWKIEKGVVRVKHGRRKAIK